MDMNELKRNLGKKHNVLIDLPHVQSWAARVLLQTQYRLLSRKQWLRFRSEFLAKEIQAKGHLACHYCHRPDLLAEVEPPHTKSRLRRLATLDHVNPRANGGSEYDMDNLVVACLPCNNKKADSLAFAHLGK